MADIMDELKKHADLSQVIRVLYLKTLEDDQIKHFFSDIDIGALEKKQSWFFASLMMEKSEGTASYMRRVHKGLVAKYGLAEKHFNAFIGCLEATFNDCEIPKEISEEFLKRAKSFKPHIIG